MVLGVLLILGAVALSWWNQKEDNDVQKAAVQIMPQLVQQIRENTVAETVGPQDAFVPELELQKPVALLTEEDKKMTEVEIDGNLYIGYLSIFVEEVNILSYLQFAIVSDNAFIGSDCCVLDQ